MYKISIKFLPDLNIVFRHVSKMFALKTFICLKMRGVCFSSPLVQHTETVNILSSSLFFHLSLCIKCIIWLSEIDTHRHRYTHTHKWRLRGDRAERRLRAFAKQGLSGVMATGADYPTLHQSGRERRGEERGIGTHSFIHIHVWRHTLKCYTISKMLLQDLKWLDFKNNKFKCVNCCQLWIFFLFCNIIVSSHNNKYKKTNKQEKPLNLQASTRRWQR